MDIYVCRHGDYANPLDIMPYRLPRVPLTPHGRMQSETVASLLSDRNVTSIASSPILRCRQTAAIIGRILDVGVHRSRLLIETGSPFAGMNRSEYMEHGYNTFDHPVHVAGGGETVETMASRMLAAVRRETARVRSGNILLVSHGDPIMSLIAGFVHGRATTDILSSMPYIPKGGLVRLYRTSEGIPAYTALNW